MTTTPQVAKSSVRRRLAVAGLTAALGLGTLGATFGFTTSPGRVRTTDRSAEVAIPGVRGSGGGAGRGLYGISSSPGRKAGGKGSIEY